MRSKTLLLSFCLTFFVGGVFAQTKSESKRPNVLEAYNSWKTNYLETGESSQPNKHQAIAVSAHRLDDKTATVQVLIISDFSNGERGFDIKVSAQPVKIQKDVNGQTSLEKSGSDAQIEASGVTLRTRQNIENVIASPSVTFPADANADAVSVSINLFDGERKISQIISVPLKYEGFATAIGRFASNYTGLLEREWCGSCDGCARTCTNCPSGQTGHFNCASCSVICQPNLEM